MKFSLFYFSANGSTSDVDRYRLLLETAKFADRHGFAALWTPERHFCDFGGLYPNPSVVNAALAMVTERIQIRAGSVVLPLHNPIRIAEEWSVVDNLSNGRVGISFASGWHPADFVLAPETYDDRKEVLLRGIQIVQRLWTGETIRLRGAGDRIVAVRTFPRPIQAKLPIWITTAGNPETWIKAGKIGAGILATLAGHTLAELAERTALYRETLSRCGQRQQSRVVVMLHTFVGTNHRDVREAVRGPLHRYLRAYFQQRDTAIDASRGAEFSNLADDEKEKRVSFGFERFLNKGALIGTPEECALVVEQLAQIGVDEIACLIDFGVDVDATMRSLGQLNELRESFA
jgi:natural product biosynthesis luciferase-like monooxygenase protein